ncbi:unnamed protein product [Pipistrellus nathusii]|uniref:Uncharacterized protein n=1 Tax=Pipistrellus nathusii TaxID=59473 RepID=A0ABN9ZMR4_PIPNA
MISEKQRNAVSPWSQQSGLRVPGKKAAKNVVAAVPTGSRCLHRPRSPGLQMKVIPDQSYSWLSMIIHSSVAENKGIYNKQISYYFNHLDIIGSVIIVRTGMITMDTQPLVPYWDLFNQALPLNHEPNIPSL